MIIILDIPVLRPSLHFNTLHPVHLIPLHNNCRLFNSSYLNFNHLQFTTLSFVLIPRKFPTAPFHLTSLHFTSLHFTSLHFTSLHAIIRRFSPHLYPFHFTPFIISFPAVVLKIFDLKGNVPHASALSWFQFLMALFNKE